MANVLKADFFKWDVVVYAEGYGLSHEVFAVREAALSGNRVTGYVKLVISGLRSQVNYCWKERL